MEGAESEVLLVCCCGFFFFFCGLSVFLSCSQLRTGTRVGGLAVDVVASLDVGPAQARGVALGRLQFRPVRGDVQGAAQIFFSHF